MGKITHTDQRLPLNAQPQPPTTETTSDANNKIRSHKGEQYLSKEQTDKETNKTRLTERSVSVISIESDDSGVGEPVTAETSSVSGTENLHFDKLPVDQKHFAYAKEELLRLQPRLEKEQFDFVKSSLRKLERLNENFPKIHKKLMDKSLDLKAKRGAFMAHSGILAHIGQGRTSPEGALFMAENMVCSLVNLLYREDIDNEKLFNHFFNRHEVCCEARSRAADNFLLKEVHGIDKEPVYDSNFPIVMILSNEVLEYQRINNLDPATDIISGAGFKAYLLDKGKCVGYEAKDGTITEQDIDNYVDQQVNELFTMDP